RVFHKVRAYFSSHKEKNIEIIPSKSNSSIKDKTLIRRKTTPKESTNKIDCIEALYIFSVITSIEVTYF
ncbi:hypothetical protein ABE44_00080, partial [Bacillus thuringiensis]|nr:hypothetical protein [Bacillus thuringiensis]